MSHHYRDLIDAGVEMWEYPGAVVHAKVVVADDQVSFGTVNLDAWALYRDFELAMIVEDPATVELFESRLFEPDIARSELAQPPTACPRPRLGVDVGQVRLLPLTAFDQASAGGPKRSTSSPCRRPRSLTVIVSWPQQTASMDFNGAGRLCTTTPRC